MANSIRVKSATEYIIEVNDQGETITFDTSDTGLTSRLFDMYEKIEALTKDYTARGAEIDARPDEPLKTFDVTNEETGELDNKAIITKNQYEGAKLIDSFYIEARTVLDMFLGAGACQKIFGDKNYTSMFDDLFSALEPHFKKMGVKAENLKKRAVEKYSPNREQRRSLK